MPPGFPIPRDLSSWGSGVLHHEGHQLRIHQDSIDIEIDVLRDDDYPAITLRCGPNLLTIDKLFTILGGIIGLPETADIRANIPGDFFSDIAFRRAVLPYDGNATSFTPKSLALDFEASFHAKGDNDSLVSANICIAYQPGPPSQLHFRASLWTPNLSPLVEGLPYQLLPAYELCDDYGPQPKAASSISLPKLIPGFEVAQPPAGIPTDVTALGFAYEDKTVSIWGTLENCTLPGDWLPTISLGQVSINGTCGPRGKTLSLQLAVQISPPDNLIDLDSTLGPSLLTGIFSYDSANGWDIEADVADLSLAHIWQFFDSSQQTALVKVMGSIMVRNLSIRYKMQKSASVTIAQKATELQIKGDVEIGLGGDGNRPPHLLFEYDYPLDGQWKMKLSFEETVSRDITIKSLLGTLSPDDGLLKSIIEHVGSLILVRKGTSSGLTIQVSPEAQGSKKNMNLRAKLQIDRFVFTYCQYTSTEENGVLKRFLLISLNQFEIPMPNIPVLKQFKSPFDISDQIFAKASAYFAITPKTCMGGASMIATCDACGLHASFSAMIDFLMNFDPFHYVLEVSIDISVSWSEYVLFVWVSFGFDITASLYMCGPPVYGTFTIKVPIKNVTVTFGDSNGQNTPAKVSLDTFRGMLQQNGQGAKEEVKISCGSGLCSKDDITGYWTVRAGTFTFDVRSNMATTQAYLNGTAVGAANKVYAKPMQLTESSNGLKADLTITVTGMSSDDQYRSDVISGNLPAALWSPYDSTKDPSVSNADRSALLDGSASTISSTYGLSVRTPRPHLSKDEIKPFKISNVIFPIILDTGATSAPVPSCPVQDESWEGKEAAGKTIAQKRETAQSIWKDANTRREGFATAWVEAMDWTKFTAVTQTPDRLINGFDKLVRGTPLVSCG
ncbi:uncharacterized protein FSUBG_4566 [Fusarium subglutinans]|uniref:DUF6603 domain-containing protein n=1 Tax=Gibberella subglutinans TaxID=42677 RepID=A0A8H5Q5P7_GIBSU|nr:uncharacterized protein FSUBG_4566 [Fusarium subglutinans]KAF5608638.1 hypothetical protein FSUBG_4566 [Fusarium subglutinans]